jgi:preprotein translocase subunit SecG
MEINPKKISIIGIFLIVIAIIGAYYSFYVIIENPEEVSLYEIYFEEDDNSLFGSSTESVNIHLDKGKYDLWYEPGGFLWLDSVNEVTVRASDGSIVYQRESYFGGGGDSISRGGKEFNRFCIFEVDASGDYNISASSGTTLYLTEYIDVGLGSGLGFLNVIFIIIGVILILAGIVLNYLKNKKSDDSPKKTEYKPPKYPSYPYPQPQYPAYPGYQYQGYPSQYPNYPPPPPPQTQTPAPIRDAPEDSGKSSYYRDNK